MADFDGRPGRQATSVCGGQQDDRVRSSSNYAATGTPDAAHTIAAPGVCIKSTFFTKRKLGKRIRTKPTYETLTGTSMASPHVAGTAALCIMNGNCPTDAPEGTRSKLLEDAEQQSSGDPTAADYYGFSGDPNTAGIVNYYGFLEYAGGY
jgi:subtilisin family serine protease